MLTPARLRAICIANFLGGDHYFMSDQVIHQFRKEISGSLQETLLDNGLQTYRHLTETLFPDFELKVICAVECYFPLAGGEADIWGEILLSDGQDAFLYFTGVND